MRQLLSEAKTSFLNEVEKQMSCLELPDLDKMEVLNSRKLIQRLFTELRSLKSKKQ